MTSKLERWKQQMADYDKATGAVNEGLADRNKHDPVALVRQQATYAELSRDVDSKLRALLALYDAAGGITHYGYYRIVRSDGVNVWECRFCHRHNVDSTDITHAADCPLVALETALAALTADSEAKPDV